MIWIRADANGEIGSGHVMRCLAIAAELEKKGERVCFLTADENASALLQARAYRVLGSDYREPEKELDRLEDLLREERPRFFLADSYYISPAYLERVRKYTAVGYMDDKGLTGLPVDVLVNYNIFAERALYGNVADCRLLLGTEYAPLRGEFSGADYRVRDKAGKVLVTTGGSNRYNLAGRFLERALACPMTAGLEYLVVSGAYNGHLERLLAMEKQNGNVTVYSNVADMERLMAESDIAVSAGGSTLYELCAVGVPMICCSFVDNQERIVEGFYRKGLTCFGGNYLTGGEEMLDAAAGELAGLCADAGLRREYSRRQRRTVDGRGAARIAEELLTFRNRSDRALNCYGFSAAFPASCRAEQRRTESW